LLYSLARRGNGTSLRALFLRLTGQCGAIISGIVNGLSRVGDETLENKAIVGGLGLAIARK